MRKTCWSLISLKRPHPFVQQLVGGEDASEPVWPAQKEVLKWMDLFESGKPPQELAYSIQNFVVIFCHLSLWLIEAHSIGSLSGLEPQTLESTGICPAIWATVLWSTTIVFSEQKWGVQLPSNAKSKIIRKVNLFNIILKKIIDIPML